MWWRLWWGERIWWRVWVWGIKMKGIKLLSFGIILFLFNLISAEGYNCPMLGGSGSGGLSFFYWILYLLILVLITSAIYWLIKSANSKK